MSAPLNVGALKTRSNPEADVYVVSGSTVCSVSVYRPQDRRADVHEEERHATLPAGEGSIPLDLRRPAPGPHGGAEQLDARRERAREEVTDAAARPTETNLADGDRARERHA